MVQVVQMVQVEHVVQVVQLVQVVRKAGPLAQMLCIQKIYDFYGLNHQIIKKS